MSSALGIYAASKRVNEENDSDDGTSLAQLAVLPQIPIKIRDSFSASRAGANRLDIRAAVSALVQS